MCNLLNILGDMEAGFLFCKRCLSENQRPFKTEIVFHLPGGLAEPLVWVFPDVVACLNCGFAEFDVPSEQLCALSRHADIREFLQQLTNEKKKNDGEST